MFMNLKNILKASKEYFNIKRKTKTIWKEFPKCMEAGEDERRDITNEIKKYVNEFE